VARVDIRKRRLLGLASTNRAFTELSREVLPWTWGAFALAALFGTLLIITRPLAYFHNHEFRAKFAGAGRHQHAGFSADHQLRRVAMGWGRPSVAAKVAGGLSLVCWIAVVYYARLTGFTMVQGD
jgi:hypothetical protein